MAAKTNGFHRYYIAPYLPMIQLKAWSRCLNYLDDTGSVPEYLAECDGFVWQPARLAWADYCDMKLLEEQAAKGIF